MKFSKVLIAVLFTCSLLALLPSPVKSNIWFMIAVGAIGCKVIINNSKQKKVALQAVRSK